MGTARTGEKALALVAVLAVAAAFAHFDPAGLMAGPLKDTEVTDCDGRVVVLDGRKAELLRLHNEARAENGAVPLCVQRNLMHSAQGHAEDMLERDFYAHETPEGLTPADRISRAGYPCATCGENNNRVGGIYGEQPDAEDLRAAFEGWMESPGHRENLLNPDFREVGFGLETGSYSPEPGATTMYVANFGSRG